MLSFLYYKTKWHNSQMKEKANKVNPNASNNKTHSNKFSYYHALYISDLEMFTYIKLDMSQS